MSQEVSTPESAIATSRDSGLALRGLWQVFAAPTALFTKLKTDPKILVPYLAIGLLALLFFVVAGDIMVRMQLETEQVQEQLAQSGMTAEQMAGMMKPFAVASGMLALLLGPLVIAGLAMFWGNFVFAGRASFRHLLSVALYGEFLFVVGAVLLLPMILAKGSLMVSLSPAVLVADQGPQSFWYVALSKLSVFHIWELIVIGTGLSVIYDFPRNKGMWLAVLSMGLLSILQVAITGITQLF